MKYSIGDIVLVDPSKGFKLSGKLVRITKFKRGGYYDVELLGDPWQTSSYKEDNLLSRGESQNNNQEDKEMEVFKKMVKAHEIGCPASEYMLALFGYDSATEQEMKDMQDKLIVARIVSRGLRLLKVNEVSDNDDLTASVAGEVVSFVDTTEYDARVANRAKKAELRKKMDSLIASKSELQTYQKYAELFPDVAELFNEYKEL